VKTHVVFTRCVAAAMRIMLTRHVIVGLMVALPARGVAAQADTASRRGAVVTRRDAGILGIALAGSGLLIGADRSISDQVRASSLHNSSVVRGVMDGGRVWGDPGVLVAGAGLWLAGELNHDRRQRLIGIRSLEAIVASSAVTSAIKVFAGRARPDRSPLNARDFVFARGFREGSDFEAFPSGHATAAFAFAAAADAEWARLSPDRPRWAAPALFGVAALTAVSRVFHDRHWTSDVLMGGAIGYVAGRAVVRWHSDRR
jgi:membrane-associated phospholipid phosphatase